MDAMLLSYRTFFVFLGRSFQLNSVAAFFFLQQLFCGGLKNQLNEL